MNTVHGIDRSVCGFGGSGWFYFRRHTESGVYHRHNFHRRCRSWHTPGNDCRRDGRTDLFLAQSLWYAALPILLAQVMVMALVGGTGGVFYRVVGGGSWGWRGFLACGAVGMVLTALFDLLTTLSFALFMFGWEWRKIAANLLTGLSFYLFHIIINTLSFAVVVPLLLQRLESVFRSADDRKGIL